MTTTTTTTMIAPNPGQTFTGNPSGTTYKADNSGTVANVQAVDVVALLDGGCLFSAVGSGSPTATLIPASGSSQSLVLPSSGDAAFYVTLTTACTLTLSGGTAGKLQTITMYLLQDATGGRTPSFSANAVFAQGQSFTASTATGAVDIVQATTVDGGVTFALGVVGTNYRGASIGQPPSANPIPPNAPAINLTAGNAQITVSWTDGLANGAAITAHKLYMGTTSGGETLVGTISTASPYIITGLTNGTLEYIQLSAVNSAGEGSKSVEASSTPTSTSIPAHYLNIPAGTTGGGAGAYTTSSAVNSPAGPINTVEFQALVLPTSTPNSGTIIGRWKSGNTALEMAVLYMNANGTMSAFYTTTGGTAASANSSAVSFGGVPTWVRAVMSATAGTIAFYTAPINGTTVPTSWTQLGTTTTGLATGSLALATATSLNAGSQSDGGNIWTGEIFAARYLVNGTLAADAEFDQQATGTTTFTDSAGVAWNVLGTGVSIV